MKREDYHYYDAGGIERTADLYTEQYGDLVYTLLICPDDKPGCRQYVGGGAYPADRFSPIVSDWAPQHYEMLNKVRMIKDPYAKFLQNCRI